MDACRFPSPPPSSALPPPDLGPPDPAVLEWLVLTPGAPVRIRADVTVDRRPFGDGGDRYRDALLRDVDRDGDGRISADEAARTPTPRVLGGGDGREAVDDLIARFAAAADRGEPGLPAAAFGDWVAGVMGPPVRVRSPAVGGANGAVLDALDADRDGRLDADELAPPAAPGPAGVYDFDADGTLSAAELTPFRSPADAAERRHFPADAPVRLLFPEPAPGLAADLAARYGSPAVPPAPQLELNVSLVAMSFGLPRVTVARNAAPDRVVVAQDGRALTVTVAGPDGAGPNGAETTLELNADRAAVLGSDAVSFGLLGFVRADGDRNGYLDEMELPAAALPGGPLFEDVDRDADGRATRDEVKAYLEEDVRLARSRVYLLAEPAGTDTDLFAALDADGDGRLSAPERRAAAARVAATGPLSAAPAGRLQLRLGPGRAPTGDGGAAVTAMAEDPTDRRTRPTEGPVWFRRSDRNGDGEVRWPEFVGPRDAFDRLDADADGALTADEADAAAP